jgi:hypothetical protein
MSLSGHYTIGEAKEYMSVYGYPKRKLPVRDAAGMKVMEIKEEILPNVAGGEAVKMYYSKSWMRPSGANVYFLSPQELIAAWGGRLIEQHKPEPDPVVENEQAPAGVTA